MTKETELRVLLGAELDHVHGGRITNVVISQSQLNGGGNTPNGNANGVPVTTVTENQNPSGQAPPGQN
jgi:hypothetical protein